MTCDYITPALNAYYREQQAIAESLCPCRLPDGTYDYLAVCWHQLSNGEGVPCQQVHDCGIRPIREFEII